MFYLLLAPAFAQDLTWTGIDYGLVTMIGTEDFREPDTIFPGMMTKWNHLFQVEMQDELRRRLKTPTTYLYDGHLYDLHLATDPDLQIVRDDSIPTTKQLLS